MLIYLLAILLTLSYASRNCTKFSHTHPLVYPFTLVSQNGIYISSCASSEHSCKIFKNSILQYESFNSPIVSHKVNNVVIVEFRMWNYHRKRFAFDTINDDDNANVTMCLNNDGNICFGTNDKNWQMLYS